MPTYVGLWHFVPRDAIAAIISEGFTVLNLDSRNLSSDTPDPLQVVFEVQFPVPCLVLSGIFNLSSGNLLLPRVPPFDVKHLRYDQNLSQTKCAQ